MPPALLSYVIHSLEELFLPITCVRAVMSRCSFSTRLVSSLLSRQNTTAACCLATAKRNDSFYFNFGSLDVQAPPQSRGVHPHVTQAAAYHLAMCDDIGSAAYDVQVRPEFAQRERARGSLRRASCLTQSMPDHDSRIRARHSALNGCLVCWRRASQRRCSRSCCSCRRARPTTFGSRR
eukprot:6204721-Pleurochrysis_carterae.AAC.6